MKYLLKTSFEYRIDEFENVEKFHEKLLEEANDGGYTLNSFSWTEKTKKAQGEVVDAWYIVKFTFIFNEATDPETIYHYQFNKQNMFEEGE